jgi:hypothetical protein
MIVTRLMGGLGNIMFQMAAGYTLAQENNAKFYWTGIPASDHPSAQGVDYRHHILAPAMRYEYKNIGAYLRPYGEHNLRPVPDNVLHNIRSGNNYIFTGYFQNYRYCSKESIAALFDFAENPLKDPEPSYFLQVRRGDYLIAGGGLHNLNLQDNYFPRALAAARTRYPAALTLVLSDDIAWCQDWEPLKDRRVQYIDADAAVSMRVMHHASLGGIISNSSFGWWGLYSNRERPLHILPDRWFNNSYYIDGYYYPGSKRI